VRFTDAMAKALSLSLSLSCRMCGGGGEIDS
jgi:hypothetical protein